MADAICRQCWRFFEGGALASKRSLTIFADKGVIIALIVFATAALGVVESGLNVYAAQKNYETAQLTARPK